MTAFVNVPAYELGKVAFLHRFQTLTLKIEGFVLRLSEVAGERLRFNNPAIADLSDENRPNKLAEKFSELYDNEWTELYETLDVTGEEEEIIGQIVSLLQV